MFLELLMILFLFDCHVDIKEAVDMSLDPNSTYSNNEEEVDTEKDSAFFSFFPTQPKENDESSFMSTPENDDGEFSENMSSSLPNSKKQVTTSFFLVHVVHKG